MHEMKKELIRLGSTEPELRTHISAILKHLDIVNNKKNIASLPKQALVRDMNSMVGGVSVFGIRKILGAVLMREAMEAGVVPYYVTISKRSGDMVAAIKVDVEGMGDLSREEFRFIGARVERGLHGSGFLKANIETLVGGGYYYFMLSQKD